MISYKDKIRYAFSFVILFVLAVFCLFEFDGQRSHNHALRRARTVEITPQVKALVNPLEALNEFSMKVVHAALGEMSEITGIQPGRAVSYEDLAFMIKISAEANIVDYNTPDMVALRTSLYEAGLAIKERLHVGGQRMLSVNLGGEYGLRHFYETYLVSGDDVTLSILPDNNGQGMVTLKMADTFLLANPNLHIFFIPKNGQHTNDLSYNDTLAYIEYDLNSDKPLLTTLAQDLGVMDNQGRIYRLNMEEQGGRKMLVKSQIPVAEGEASPRFIVLADGPQVQGLSPATVSRTVASAIASSDAVIAEGQAFAEIRGWRREAYLSFMMKGRAAMALHGENKDIKLTAFARLPAGSLHYYNVEAQMDNYYECPVTGVYVGEAEMSTREYMNTLASREWRDFVETRFSNNEELAIAHIVERSLREDRSFKDIVLEETGVSAFSIKFPEFILSEYQDPAQRDHYQKLADIVSAVASASGATLLQQRCVWEAAAISGLTLPSGSMVGGHWVETNVRAVRDGSRHERESEFPKYYSLEIQFLARVLRVSEIILSGIESGKSESEIVRDVQEGGVGNIYSRILSRFVGGDERFVPQIGRLIP